MREINGWPFSKNPLKQGKSHHHHHHQITAQHKLQLSLHWWLKNNKCICFFTLPCCTAGVLTVIVSYSTELLMQTPTQPYMWKWKLSNYTILVLLKYYVREMSSKGIHSTQQTGDTTTETWIAKGNSWKVSFVISILHCSFNVLCWKEAWTDLNPFIKGIKQGQGVSMFRLQGLACRLKSWHNRRCSIWCHSGCSHIKHEEQNNTWIHQWMGMFKNSSLF